ncbi:MAG: UPF0104 family protein [Cyanobacteria bacterium J06621_8]
MKQILARIKPYLRWFILGGVLFFLVKTIKERWSEIAAVSIDSQGGLILAIALLITIIAHLWSGWVWTWILGLFQQPLGGLEGIRVYLLTNIAKYSPGNIWHFYGRISAVTHKGGSRGVATLSVLLEPLLMAAAALLVGLIASGWSETSPNWRGLQLCSLLIVLVGIHPQILNALLHRLSKSKADAVEVVKLTQYPLLPFLGEIGFVMLRGIGFILTFMALQTIAWEKIPQLFTAFSFAWLLGLVVPGAPGGLGVFEVTAYSLLNDSLFPAEIAAIALYRLISILAEAIAALAVLKVNN